MRGMSWWQAFRQTHKQAVRQVLVRCSGLDKLPMPLEKPLASAWRGRGVSLPSDYDDLSLLRVERGCIHE